jgi:protein-tyrosine-phosphatase
MAVAFFRQLADPLKAEAVSAGTAPAAQVHAGVVAVMQEVGIDLTAARPQLLTQRLSEGASLLVTMGCGESCPYVPGVAVEDWPVPDPNGQSPEMVRPIRDDIRARVASLVDARRWS